ncbi:MAG: AMP-dependent synthetase [Agromyces sp.]|nr:AMP-dependent synthetase [Agromyces sp.]
MRNEREVRTAGAIIADAITLPPHSVGVHAIAEFPRTPNGKSDLAALARHAALLEREERTDATGTASVEGVRDLYAELLGRPDASLDDSFTTLGGDSLSYIEVSLRLERLIGGLPSDWPSRSIRQLAAHAEDDVGDDVADDVAEVEVAEARPSPRPKRRSWLARVETSVVLRAVAILLIVATHADLIALKGGAHLLLGVAGFNLARFKLTEVPRGDRVRGLLRAAGQIAVPAVLWIGGVALIARSYDPATVILANNLFGQHERWGEQWQFWFLEALVWAILALAALLLVPRLDALERRHRFAFALAVVGVTLVLRLIVAGGITAGSPERYAMPVVVWLIALGWLVARSTTTAQRIVTTVLILVTTPGFFGDPLREGIIAVGLLLLLWLPTIPVPAVLTGALGTIASASLFVYLTHWQVYPPIEEVSPALAIVASFAVGILAWRGYGLLERRARALWSATRRRLPRA